MTTPISSDRAFATPASRSNAAAPGDAQEHQLAWQREMERAQLSNWFKPDLSLRDGAAAPRVARPARGAASHRSGSPEEPRPMVAPRALFANTLASMSSTAMSVHAGDGASRGPASSPQDAAKGLPRSEACDVPGMQKVPLAVRTVDESPATKALPEFELNRIEAAESRPFLSTASSEPPPVMRLHAEPRPQGQAMWIAMRADDVALRAMLPGIVADLQRALRGRGERLHLVVCNGRPIWREGIALAHGDNEFDSFHTREI